MKKLGFTLAEVLITLMILGVIAAMTVPTLIQDTQKKEQVVQIKKGLSMINQAVTMDYALNQKYVSEYNATSDVIGMLQNRLATSSVGTDYISTSDGLTYFFSAKNNSCTEGPLTVTVNGGDGEDKDNIASVSNLCYSLIIATKPTGTIASYAAAANEVAVKGGTKGVFTGYYAFLVGADRVIAAPNTQKIINADNLKNLKTDDLPNSSVVVPVTTP